MSAGMAILLLTASCSVNLRNWAAARVKAVHRAQQGHPLDAVADRNYWQSWRANTASGKPSSLLYAATSEIDDSMQIEVREYGNGWRTMNLVSQWRSVTHGTCKFSSSGELESSAVLSEYIKTMASLVLAGVPEGELRNCAFLGLGAGTLPNFIGSLAPSARLCAVELDGTVCTAACAFLGIDQRVAVVEEDAVRWLKRQAQDPSAAGGLDALFIDVFDENNSCPAALWSDEVLVAMRQLLSPRGVVVHNMHVGSEALNASFAEATSAYASTFPSVCHVTSLDSRPWAGNALMAASMAPGTFDQRQRLEVAARRAQSRHPLLFDAAARCREGHCAMSHPSSSSELRQRVQPQARAEATPAEAALSEAAVTASQLLGEAAVMPTGFVGKEVRPEVREVLTCEVLGFYPFGTGVAGHGASSFLWRDTHVAIRVRSSRGGALLMDFMTKGGQLHPVWWDERVKWSVLLGGSIRGEVRIRELGARAPADSKLGRLRTVAESYDDEMNLYSSNCRTFAARMRRAVERLNAQDAECAGVPPAPSQVRRAELAADARLALGVVSAGLLPALYPLGILALCWEGLTKL